MSTVLGPTLTRSETELSERFALLADASDVADLLEVPLRFLTFILYWGKGQSEYRRFEIAKKSGGARLISAPPTNVQILQSKLNSVLGLVYVPKTSVHGFVADRSIVTNASPHVGKRFVLNLDLVDFFPSIHFGRVRGMLMAKPYSIGAAAATVLAKLVTDDGVLPQGAPTSPTVSNMVCGRLDGHMLRLCRKFHAVYTRYADDVTISTNRREFPRQLADPSAGWVAPDLILGDELLHVIKTNWFEVNDAKTRLQTRSKRQEVTGITVNKIPNLRRRYVRQIRAMIHAWDKYGEANAEKHHRERYRRAGQQESVTFRRVVKGKLDYLKMVKGESDRGYRRLTRDLHKVAPDLVAALPDIDRPPADEIWQRYAREYANAVYQTVIYDGNGDPMAGTAFAWRRGVVATAAHNLAAEEVFISPPFPDKTPVPEGAMRLHQRGAENVDCALVDLPDGVECPTTLPLRIEPVGLGEQVAVLAYAKVAQHLPDLGIYPGYVESVLVNYLRGVKLIQVTAEISGGMSGGPVIDRLGNLVGIALGKTYEETGEGVPSRAFRHVLPVGYLSEIG